MTLSEQIKTKFPNLALESYAQQGDSVVIVKKEAIKEIAFFLKNDPSFQFNLLADLFAVDYLYWEEKAERFEITYNLFSITNNQRIFIKVRVAEDVPEVDSITALWPAANWFEREVWDMFGIRFQGHPNLKRILMYEEFKGHPLRKDYPFNKRQPLIGPMN